MHRSANLHSFATFFIYSFPFFFFFFFVLSLVHSRSLMKSFIPVSSDSHFPIENIPFGIFSPTENDSPRVGVAIGEFVFDLAAAAEQKLFQNTSIEAKAIEVFSKSSLNAFMSLGYSIWSSTRHHVQYLLSSDSPLQSPNPPLFHFLSNVIMHLPCQIGDYTDFYASKEHATNVGTLFRGPQNALPPNWLHLPIGYHGRASSIVVSNTPLHRPQGQQKGGSTFGPSQKLDFELEMACLIGTGNKLGQPMLISQVKEHIFGMVLMNDWSARDIQAWYQPLGPFLGKSFGTTISPWVVTLDALEPFLVDAPEQTPVPLPYLQTPKHEKTSYDIHLTVEMKPKESNEYKLVCKSNLKYMYWSIFQQCAHHTINGCNLRTGDIFGTGTISGSTPDSFGSLLEITWNGEKEIVFNEHVRRTFIQDGDTIRMTAFCSKDGLKIGFGECTGVVLPSVSLPFPSTA